VTVGQQQFPFFSRILHWTMAVMVLAMLFIGIGMVASLSEYHRLVTIHKPLGILILILVTIRLVNRLLKTVPRRLGSFSSGITSNRWLVSPKKISMASAYPASIKLAMLCAIKSR